MTSSARSGLTDLDVLTPAGRGDLHRVAVGFEFDLELQAVQDVQNHIGGHSDAEDGIDAADLGREMLPSRGAPAEQSKWVEVTSPQPSS